MEHTQKTRREWYYEFPDPYKCQAILNTENEQFDEVVDSAELALRGGFDWQYSPQGYEYWNNFHKTLLNPQQSAENKPEEKLPTFKAGDRIWYIRDAKWYVLEATDHKHYPLCIELEDGRTAAFTIDGKALATDAFPFIFHREQTFDFSKPHFIPEKGQLVTVWGGGFKYSVGIGKFDKMYGNQFKIEGLDASFDNCLPYPELPYFLKGGEK